MLQKKFMKYFLAFHLVINLQADTLYTVDELLLKSLENSPELKVSNLKYEASQERYNASFSNYLPKIDLQASVARGGMSDTTNPNNTLLKDTFLLGGLSLKQIIYDFGKTGSNADYYEYDSDSYLFSNHQKISDKIREVKEAYYNLLKAQALIDVQVENVKLNSAQLYRSEKYFTAGIRTKIDVSDANVKLIKSKIDLKNAQYNLKLAYAKLDRVVGFTSTTNSYTVYTPKLNLNKLYDNVINYDLNLQESIEFAYMNKPELLQYQANVKSAESLVDVSSSEYYPALYLGAEYIKQSELNEFAPFVPEEQWQVGVNLNWNLYQGGGSAARIQESKLNAAASDFQLHDLKLQIKNQVTNEYINVYRRKDTLELSQSLMEAAALKFEQAGKRYENGLSDYIELQQARQEYIDSKASLVVDYYDYYVAIANLDNAIGK